MTIISRAYPPDKALLYTVLLISQSQEVEVTPPLLQMKKPGKKTCLRSYNPWLARPRFIARTDQSLSRGRPEDRWA